MAKTLQKLTFGIATALAMAIAAGPASADMNATCKAYAISAVKQHQANLKNKCDLKGDLWSANIVGHANYCKSNPPAKWRSATESRAKALAGCK